MFDITVLTSGRADYSILSPVLAKLSVHPAFRLRIAAFGMHLIPANAAGLKAIKNDGYTLDLVGPVPGEDSPQDISETMGAVTQAFARYLADNPASALLCVGDRFEMFSAVSATVPFGLPVVHLHGGEETAGAMDDVFRHSISAMSWLHFTAHQQYSMRVRQILGSEVNDRVFTVGAPGIDALLQTNLLDKIQFEDRFGVDMSKPTLLATYHPETRAGQRTLNDVDAFCDALRGRPEQVILTLPNADTYGNRMRTRLVEGLRDRPKTFVFDMLGREGYYSALSMCKMVVGNSSSGIIEAASFRKPVVNIGI